MIERNVFLENDYHVLMGVVVGGALCASKAPGASIAGIHTGSSALAIHVRLARNLFIVRLAPS